MFVPSLHRAVIRRAPRLSSFTASVWALLLAACGGGGGGGGSGGSAPVASGPVASGPVASTPVAPDSEASTPGDPDPVAPEADAPDADTPDADAPDADAPDADAPDADAPDADDGTPPDPDSSSNDPQHRDDPPSDARQVQTQTMDAVPARMEILPLVSLPARPSAGADQWIRIADIRVLNRSDEAIEGDWSYSVDDTRFHADSEGLHVRAGSDFSRLVSENLNVQITVRGTPDQQISQTAEIEIEIVDRAENLDLHIYENHPFHKPIGYLTQAAGWHLADSEGDNALFHVDKYGRVWFIGTPRVPLLDFERPADSDGNNTYQLRLTRIVDGREEALNLSVQVHNIVNERNWAQRNDYQGLLGRSREADFHHEVPDELEHLMHGSHWLMPSSGPLVLTWSLRTLFSPDQMNAGLRPSRSQLLADMWQGRDGRPRRDDSLLFLDSVQEIDEFRATMNRAFDKLQQQINVRFIEVDESIESAGHFRVWTFRSQSIGLFSAETLGEARFPMGSGWKFLRFNTLYQSDTRHLIPHEIGHLLCLKHPWHATANGWATDGRPEQESKDRTDTVMSYNRNGASGWQEMDLRSLKLIYGAAAGADGPNPPPGHQPFAGRQGTSVHPETDLFDDNRGAEIVILDPDTDRPMFSNHLVDVKIFPSDMGEKLILKFKFLLGGESAPAMLLNRQLRGEHAGLLTFRSVSDVDGEVTFGLYVRNVDEIPFFAPGVVHGYRVIAGLSFHLAPQFDATKFEIRFETDRPVEGEFLIKGRPVTGLSLDVFTDGLRDGYQAVNVRSVEWTRDGDTAVLSNDSYYRPEQPGTYKARIELYDPTWRKTTILEKQIEVRANYAPEENYNVVRIEDTRWSEPRLTEHNGTDEAEWFHLGYPQKSLAAVAATYSHLPT